MRTRTRTSTSGPPAGAADWPSGGSWFPPLLRTEDLEALGQISQNYSVFSEEDVDTRIDDILAMPIEEQAAAWNELDEYIAETYMPAVRHHV